MYAIVHASARPKVRIPAIAFRRDVTGGPVSSACRPPDDVSAICEACAVTPSSPSPTDLPELTVADSAAWREWLAEHGQSAPGVWLVLAKKGTTDPTRLTYAEAVEEALCHGWIDGQRGPRDDATFRNRFTPRRPRSPWSARNVTLVTQLAAAGRMQPTGLAEIERAKADGRWDSAYAGQASMEVPADLAAALAADPSAAAMFDILTRQNRYAVLFRVHSAKREDTRARRIAQYVAMLGRGETIYPQKRSRGE
jgi:uncharacterized protein YdeI (YjbR/CyaY-like superfamily)